MVYAYLNIKKETYSSCHQFFKKKSKKIKTLLRVVIGFVYYGIEIELVFV